MNDNIIELFCLVDDFCQVFYPDWEKQMITLGLKKRVRRNQLSPSEIMTLFIQFHQSYYRNFKQYYLQYVTVHLKFYFPGLLSYQRFVALLKSILIPLCYLLQLFKGEKTGIYFVDSTILRVCHVKRAKRNKIFKDLAKKAKSTMGWYFGFKLHLVINDKGELMACKLTAGNVDDRTPVPSLVQGLMSKIVGDKGYISQALFDQLRKQELQLITRIRKNMKNRLVLLADKLLLRKRGVIESVNDQLKNISQVEHTRHRSVWNFMVNVLGALIAYSL